MPGYIAPDFGFRNMVCQPIVRLSKGNRIFGADAHPESSAMWLNKDQGQTWEDTGGSIIGIHAAIVEFTDGRLMALGRGGNIDGHMPMSISSDYGKKWNLCLASHYLHAALVYDPSCGGSTGAGDLCVRRLHSRTREKDRSGTCVYQ
jgi:hypothetical protein